jgi:hypothetical protein
MSDALIVVSYYAKRTREHLDALLSQLEAHGHDTLIVTNSDSARAGQLSRESRNRWSFERPNVGMNIGAWAAGWCALPTYEYYLFLQDECRIERDDFLEAYIAALNQPRVGLVGETINPKWAQPWAGLLNGPLDTVEPEHEIDGRSTSRVRTYLHYLGTWGIEPGSTATHLRSLVWFTRRGVIEEIGGFPAGRNRGECIAAEIAVSRAIEQRGYRVMQASDEPFTYISHAEWRRDGWRKLENR